MCAVSLPLLADMHLSRVHIPKTFQDLMTDENSPIIDFYPETFQIDMNGKRMAWQGVALLPFIDQKRLLDAMAPRYSGLTEEEVKRNTMGNNVIFVFEDSPFYHVLEALYGKRKSKDVSNLFVTGISTALTFSPACPYRPEDERRRERQPPAKSRLYPWIDISMPSGVHRPPRYQE